MQFQIFSNKVISHSMQTRSYSTKYVISLLVQKEWANHTNTWTICVFRWEKKSSLTRNDSYIWCIWFPHFIGELHTHIDIQLDSWLSLFPYYIHYDGGCTCLCVCLTVPPRLSSSFLECSVLSLSLFLLILTFGMDFRIECNTPNGVAVERFQQILCF